MKFFCPQCQAPIESSGEGAHVACPQCGYPVDLTRVQTNAGQPFVPIILDESGQDIGPYHLERCLGSGGMGRVYLASDPRSNQVYAIKLLYPQFASNSQMLARFGREASVLKELNHPRVVGYVDQGQSQGRHYLVMEYVEGENLDAKLKRGPIPTAQALGIVQEICEALDAAHSQGVVHRDLKPANIIISPTGVKILDFGIAHITLNDHTLTHTDAIIGTLNYMSPEQRAGSKNIDARSDLFALGVIFYHMLTGALPLGAFEPVSRFNNDLNRRFDRLTTKLLSNRPELRHQSASELARDLARLSPAPRGHGRLSIAIAAAAVCLAAYLIAYTLVPWAISDKAQAGNNTTLPAQMPPLTTTKSSTSQVGLTPEPAQAPPQSQPARQKPHPATQQEKQPNRPPKPAQDTAQALDKNAPGLGPQAPATRVSPAIKKRTKKTQARRNRRRKAKNFVPQVSKQGTTKKAQKSSTEDLPIDKKVITKDQASKPKKVRSSTPKMGKILNKKIPPATSGSASSPTSASP